MEDAVSLRPMRWWDIADVLLLERELFPDDPWSAGLFWGELAGVPRTRHYLVAVDARDRLVGYAGLSVAGSVGDVQTLAVVPGAQGRGVGTRLLHRLLDEARRRRCSAVLLEVRADNAAARKLYDTAGFERISVRRGYYDQGRVDAYVLRLRLPASVAGSVS